MLKKIGKKILGKRKEESITCRTSKEIGKKLKEEKLFNQ